MQLHFTICQKKVFKILAIAGALIFTTSCTTVVPDGYTGIEYNTRTGIVEDEGLNPGRYRTGLFHIVVPVSNKQQTGEYEAQIWGECEDQTVVYAEGITITYKINKDYTVWLYKNVALFETQKLVIPDTLIESSVKSSMRKLKATEVTDRSKIEPMVTEELQSSLNDRYQGNEAVTIFDVAIKQMDFEDSYNEAIAAKAQLTVEQEKAEKEKEIALINAEKEKAVALTNAEKEKETAIANAEKEKATASIEAEAKLIEAEAEAQAQIIKAEAEAEANKLIAESITPELLEQKKLEKWNGDVPQVQGAGSLIVDVSE